MRIIDGKIRNFESITIELDDGKVIVRKIGASKTCPSLSTFFVNIGGKRVKVSSIERAEITDLNETERKMMDELQSIYDKSKDDSKKSKNVFYEYYSYVSLFVRDVIGHDIIVRDGRVIAVVG